MFDGHLRPVGEVDRRVEHQLLAALQPILHFHRGSKIAVNVDLLHFDMVAVDDRDVHPLLVEDQGVGRDEDVRRGSRDVERDIDEEARPQHAIGILHVDLGVVLSIRLMPFTLLESANSL